MKHDFSEKEIRVLEEAVDRAVGGEIVTYEIAHTIEKGVVDYRPRITTGSPDNSRTQWSQPELPNF